MAETYTHTHTHTHTHGCLCKTIIPIIATFAIINPSYSDIAKNAQSATCDSSTIGTTTGPANLQADWTANTIHLDWYSNDTKQTSTTCSYDGTITLPSTPQVPTGYTFGGWRVRIASNNNNTQTPITLSSLYSSETINVFSSKSLNPGVFCEGSGGWDDENDEYAFYGTDQQGEGACSDSRFSGLNNGEWRVTMPNGSIVKGEATCSTTSGNNHISQWGGNSSDWELSSDALQAGQYSTDNSSGMLYCWCKATSVDTGSGYQSVASSSWVLYNNLYSAYNCAYSCADSCAFKVDDSDDFRRAVFGVTQ